MITICFQLTETIFLVGISMYLTSVPVTFQKLNRRIVKVVLFFTLFSKPAQKMFSSWKQRRKESYRSIIVSHLNTLIYRTEIVTDVENRLMITKGDKGRINERLGLTYRKCMYAAAAESLQSCPTLCDPKDCSPPGSSVYGIFQARVLEWGAIAFSEIYNCV